MVVGGGRIGVELFRSSSAFAWHTMLEGGRRIHPRPFVEVDETLDSFRDAARGSLLPFPRNSRPRPLPAASPSRGIVFPPTRRTLP